MRMALAAVGLVTLLASCSSSTKQTAPNNQSTGPTGAAASAGSATSAATTSPVPNLSAQLLTIADLPTGWSVDNSSISDTDAPACLKTAKKLTDTPHKIRADFVKGTDFPSLTDSIGYFGSANSAKQKFSAAAQVLTACKDVSFDSDGTHVTGTVGAMSFPNFGDQSAAWQFTFNAEGQSFGVIEVLVQKGAELELLAFGDTPSPSADDFESLCQTAVAKLP